MSRYPTVGIRAMDRTRTARLKERRKVLGLRPLIEGLEDRCVPATITWNTTLAPTGGDWDTASNWVGGVVPTSADYAVINLTSAGQVTHNSSTASSVQGLTTNANTTFKLNAGSLALGLTNTKLGGPTTVGFGTSMTLASNGNLRIDEDQVLTVNGDFTAGLGATLTMIDGNFANTSGLVVNGTMTANTVTFVRSVTGNGNDTTRLLVNPGGRLKAVNSTFGWDQVAFSNGTAQAQGDLTNNGFDTAVYAPATLVPQLTANRRFGDVHLLAGTLNTGQSLALNLIGTDTTANQRYIFDGTFDVQSGATMSLGGGVRVLISEDQVVTVNGSLSASTGATIAIEDGNFANTSGLVVNGTMTVAGTTFSRVVVGNANDTTRLLVSPGGRLIATDSVFGWDQVHFANGTAQSQGDLTSNGFDTTVLAPATLVPQLVANRRFRDVDLLAGSLTSGQSLSLDLLGTDTTANLRYVFTGAFDVQSKASLSIGTGVSVLISEDQVLTINGALGVASGVTIAIEDGPFAGTSGLVVNGTMDVQSTTFSRVIVSNSTDTTRLLINPGGRLTATDSTFAWDQVVFSNGTAQVAGDLARNGFDTTLYLPASILPQFTPNRRFRDVDFLAGSLTTGQSLALDPIGTDTTANQRYVFTGGFVIQAGATLSVGSGSRILIAEDQVLTVTGTFNVNSPESFAIEDGGFSNTSGIVVNGVMNVQGTAFTRSLLSNSTDVTQILVNSGGKLAVSNSRFAWDNVTIGSNAEFTLESSRLSGVFAVNSNATLNVHGNDFSGIGSNGLIASGDAAKVINFEKNYWGTSDPALIGAKILDKADDVTRPSVDFDPIFLNGPGAVSADPVTRAFSSSSRVVSLHAVVTSTTGGTVTLGTVTFNVFRGSERIGPVVSGTVSNGQAFADFTIPAALAVGTYTIQAIYSDPSGTYFGAIDASQFLTITRAVTSTASVDQSTTFDPSAGQTIDLVATVTSASGSVGEGTATFTILSFGSPVGSPVTVPVVLDANGIGTANATYSLPIGTAGGTYVIQAVYNGTSNLAGSSDNSKRLTIVKADTTTAAQATNIEYAVAGQSITLAATVESPVGTVNEGTVTFALKDSSGTIVNIARTGTVSGGQASVSYVLPSGLAVGTYTIQTTYNGTVNYKTSSDVTQTLTITAGGTTVAAVSTTVIYSALNDQDLTFSATVTSNSGTVNGGTITFTLMSGLTVIGTPVTSSAVAGGSASVTYTVPKLTGAGTYVIKAKYNGTGTFLSSNNDVTHSLVVTAAPTTTAADPVSSTVTYSTADQQFNVSAVVSSARGTVNAGTVTFRLLKDSVSIGSTTANVDSSGHAVKGFTLVGGAAAGTYILEATYNGSANFAGSTQANRAVIVVQAATTTTGDPASTVFSGLADQFVTLGATIANPSGGIVNAGQATFTIFEGTTVVGDPVNGDVIAGRSTVSYRIPLKQHGGDYTLRVDYGGSPNFLPFIGTGSTFTISTAPVAALTGVASSVYDAAADVTVPVSSSVTSARGTVSEGTVTFTLRTAGETAIGNPVTSTVVSAGTAAASLTVPAGTPGGSYRLFAHYNGTGNFAAQDAPVQSFTILAAAPALATTTPAAPATFSAVAGVSVPVSTVITSTSGPVTEGQVTFRVVRDSQIIGTPVTVNVDAKGQAAASYTLPAGARIGSYTVEAAYGGTSNFSAFTDSSQTIHVSSTTTTIASGGSTSYDGTTSQSLVFTATVTADSGDIVNIGHVEFTVVNASDQPIGATVSGNVVNNKASATYTLPQGVAAGTYRLKTKYFDPPDFFDSVDDSQVVQVSPATTSASLPAGAVTLPYTTGSQGVPLSLTVTSPGGSVDEGKATFQILSGATVIAEVTNVSVVNGVATATPNLSAGLGAGTYTIHAIFGNAANFGGSTAVDRTLTIAKAATTAAVSPASTTYNPAGATVALSATIDSKSGTVSAGNVTFKVLDGGGKAVATSSPVAVNAGSVATAFTLPANLASGTYTVQADYLGTANLVVSLATSPLTIARATPSLNWATPADIIYGTPLTSAQLNASSNLSGGSFVYSKPLNTVLDAGQGQKIDVDYVPTDSTNYTTVKSSVMINVKPADPVFSAVTASQTITYGKTSVVLSGKLAAPTAIPSSSPNNVITVDVGGLAQGTGTIQSDGSFVVTVPVATLPASAVPYVVTYAFAGTSNFLTKTDNKTWIAVDKIVPIITVTTSTGTIPTTPSYPGKIVLRPTTEPSLPITPGPASNLTITPNPGGGYLVEFNQNLGAASVQFLAVSTDPNIQSPDPVTLNFTVQTGAAGISIDPTPLPYTGTPRQPVFTTEPAGLNVTFSYMKDGKAVVNPTAAGVYEVTATVVDARFTGSTTATMTIARAVPTVSWSTPSDIVYGTPLSSAQLSAFALVPGSFVYTPAAGQVLNVGDGQVLRAVFTPTDQANYTTATANVSINVKKPQPAFSNIAAPSSIVYGTSTIDVSGKIALSPTVLPARQPITITIGTASAVATVGDDGTFSAAIDTSSLGASTTPYSVVLHYDGDVSFGPANDSSKKITVTKAATAVSWITPQPIVYGTALSASQLNAAGSVPGSIVYTPALGQVLNAGGQVLTATFTPTDSANFAGSSQIVTLNVLKASPAFSLLTPSPSLVYGQPLTLSGKLAAGPAAATSNVTVVINGSLSKSVTPGADGKFTLVFNDTTSLHVGNPLLISYQAAASANFEAAGDSSTSLTVTPAADSLTFVNPPTSAAYNTPLTLGLTSTSGRVPTALSATGATVSGLTITPTASTGSITITAHLDASGDYQAVSKTLVLSAARADAGVVYTNLSAIYDGTPHPAQATSVIPVSKIVYTSADGSTSDTAPVNAGSYFARAVIDDPNYLTPDSAVLVIARQVVTMDVIVALNSIYNGQPITAVATISSPLVAAPVPIFTQNGVGVTPVNVGTYVVTATLSNPNFQAAPVQKIVRITPATPSFAGTISPPPLDSKTTSFSAGGTLVFPGGVPAGAAVTIHVVGTAVTQTVPVASNGTFAAVLDGSSLAPGSYLLEYRYDAIANFAAASDVKSLTVLAPPPLVSPNSISTISKKKNTADAIVLTFNGPLDSGSATNTGNYTIKGPKGAVISRADYSNANGAFTVTLTFKKRISTKKKVTLTITSGGVNDTEGRGITGTLELTVPKKGISNFSLRSLSLANPPHAHHGLMARMTRFWTRKTS